MRSSLDTFDAAVESGGCVLSAERNVVLSLVKEATENGHAATFYVTKAQYDAIMSWYWSPERRKRHGMEAVTLEERQRIESELGIKDPQFRYSNRMTCENCGSAYGAFEFIQQGIREHGREVVETALTLANAAVVRVNPSTIAVCQTCRAPFSGGQQSHYYDCGPYGCCKMEPMT